MAHSSSLGYERNCHDDYVLVLGCTNVHMICGAEIRRIRTCRNDQCTTASPDGTIIQDDGRDGLAESPKKGQSPTLQPRAWVSPWGTFAGWNGSTIPAFWQRLRMSIPINRAL